jgi:EAL domain-containing protein (putative c-di-GMP-specific phosphodiesterase class I)/putative methionine-R-sulfoxide reductase with GAF domain
MDDRDPHQDPLRLMQRVAEQALCLIDSAEGVLIALLDWEGALTHVCGAGTLTPYIGFRNAMAQSLSGEAMRSGQVLITEDAAADPRANAVACLRMNVASSICIPLTRDGYAFGVLNVTSSHKDAFVAEDAGALDELAEFVSVVVGAASDLDRVSRTLLADAREREGALEGGPVERTTQFVTNVLSPHAIEHVVMRQRIERVLRDGSFSMAFQPVVQLSSGALAGYEALARFDGDPQRTPDVWFAEAAAVGLGVELELAAVSLALSYQGRFGPRAVIAINVGPGTLASPRLLEMLKRVDGSRVVIELTEHSEDADYEELARVIDRVRSTGARLTIDDTGSGLASLAHISKLGPEFIKLDREITIGIDRDPVRRALAASLVAFAAETGPVVVAEGIERAEELRVVESLGVSLGQGYYFGAPLPFEQVRRANRQLVDT